MGFVGRSICGVCMVDHVRVLEAVLFAAAEPLSVAALHERMPDDADIGEALSALCDSYEGRGVELVERDGHWAFRTAEDLAAFLTEAKEEEKKLSQAAQEVLAIIAYHQPVTRGEIENIRGVSTSRGTLDVLIEAGWVKPGRRRETPGRPLTWLTTPAFLDEFSLTSLMDLPGLDDLKAAGLLDRRPAIDTLAMPADLFDEEANEHDEHEDLTDTRQARLDEESTETDHEPEKDFVE